MVSRFDVHRVPLNPTTGSEIKKTRPCVIISSDKMNNTLKTVIIAPMTTTIKGYSTRMATTFQNKKGEIALDQIRAIDQNRLVKKLGQINAHTATQLLDLLREIFSQ